MKAKRLLCSTLLGLFALLFWLLVWYLVSLRVDSPLLLPDPLIVLQRLFTLLLTRVFWRTVFVSIGRILFGILVGVLLAIPVAVLSAKVPLCDTLLRPLLTAIRSTPVAAFIILLWLWVGGDYVPSIITVLIVLPVIEKNLEEGLRSADPALLDVTRVFRIPLPKRILVFDIPSLLPFLRAALQTAIGLGWKSGIAAEIIVRPAKAIGRMISDAKYSLEYVDIFAWTLVVILLSVLIERLLSLLFSRAVSATSDKPERREEKPL